MPETHLCDTTCRALAANAIEVKRTKVLRDLMDVRNKLTTTQEALAGGALAVAEEYNDRALETVAAALATLRDMDAWHHDCRGGTE